MNFLPRGKFSYTTKLKISADKNICGNNICGQKIPFFLVQEGDFSTAKIFSANIFIRKFFVNDGILTFLPPN
jgi:hypothetical protein